MPIAKALAYTANHKDAVGYIGKSKLIKAGLGDREAASLTPTDIEQWLSTRSKTAATYNRYKAFLSLAYRLGIRERKVSTNPARDALHRKEPGGRERFLSDDEYTVLHDVIARKYPLHLAEFVVSVHSGMRLGEQYLCRWIWYRPDRSVIRLPGSVTKNGKPRDVILNADSVAAIESLRRPGQKGTDRIFPREVKAARKGTKDSFDNRSWFEPCLAEAGIEGYVWHCNRHTFCSWLAMSGASILQIMVAAGHSGAAMAARYSHLNTQSEESPVHRLAKTPVAAA